MSEYVIYFEDAVEHQATLPKVDVVLESYGVVVREGETGTARSFTVFPWHRIHGVEYRP